MPDSDGLVGPDGRLWRPPAPHGAADLTPPPPPPDWADDVAVALFVTLCRPAVDEAGTVPEEFAELVWEQVRTLDAEHAGTVHDAATCPHASDIALACTCGGIPVFVLSGLTDTLHALAEIDEDDDDVEPLEVEP